MFGFLIPVGNEPADPLTDVAAAQSFWHALPRKDPIAAQEALCAAVAEPIARGRANIDRLQALLALEQRAQELVDALLLHDVARNPQAHMTRSPSWQAAFELCRSFGSAYGLFLRLMYDSQEFEGRREYQSAVLSRYLRQRQLELLLRPFCDERSTRFAWKEIHEAYRFAQSRGLLHQNVPINANPSRRAVKTTLEREYVQVLMQDLMNGGHFPPYDALWVSQRVPHWCKDLALKSSNARGGESWFVVDPDGDAGVLRSDGESAAACLRLDMSRVLHSIRGEMALLRDVADRPSQGSSLGPRRQLKVLQKVNFLCSIERPVIARRGERKPTAVTVEVAVGTAQVLRSIRNKPDGAVAAIPRAPAGTEATTITVFGGPFENAKGTYPNGADTVTPSSAGASSNALLTMVDDSDSGCRLHGPTLVRNPAIPGALIAFREDAASSWRLAVVRRVKKRLAGRRVEIGAEYLGTNPRWVVVVANSDTAPGKAGDGTPLRCAGLYLPESTAHPVLPLKTLVLPACGLSTGALLSVRSRKSVHTIRLKEPLDEQADFVWVPFEILDRRVKDEPESSGAMAEVA